MGESKVYSISIFHEELAAFRKESLKKVGGFLEDIGTDDSRTAIK